VSVTLHLGDCLDVVRSMPDGCVDAVVCDPPYGLSFMGKGWDHGVPGVEFWIEALRVAKPGAHLLAFGGTRTYHRLACAIEDAGWQIKDCLSWLYGSGFPKHRSLLKPAWEPVVMAAKAGRRVVNVDACRLATNAPDRTSRPNCAGKRYAEGEHVYGKGLGYGVPMLNPSGRWPANVMLDEEAAEALDRQSGERPSPPIGSVIRRRNPAGYQSASIGAESRPMGSIVNTYGDSGGASRFFYCAKASRSERDEAASRSERVREDGGAQHTVNVKKAWNHHPTVKPVALMRWLVRLVCPEGGTVLDPFMGSGTTGVACIREGRSFIGIEREPEYHAIAEARIAHARGETRPDAEQPGLDFGVSA
jgi:site-specific DNA-methyltransferase (adenine-specific)